MDIVERHENLNQEIEEELFWRMCCLEDFAWFQHGGSPYYIWITKLNVLYHLQQKIVLIQQKKISNRKFV